MRIHLQYGRDGLDFDMPGEVTVVEPRFVAGLPDERAAFAAAVRRPVKSPPLADLVMRGDRIAIVIPDITRPLPTARLLPWLLEALGDVDPADIVIVNGTGSHRVNTPEELREMVGAPVMEKVRVVNHDSQDTLRLAPAGVGKDGRLVFMNRDYIAADRRIVLGFIEPHFMAGFSGGYKGIFPGVADLPSIMRYHNAEMIGHPKSTWGLIEGNPTQERIRHDGALAPVDFCINVTLNNRREITKFFCGDPVAAHDEGCAYSRETAMAPCAKPFPIVVTTNSGYPLDQNLYQAVKGMSAAAQIVSPGGLIVSAARCNDGFPAHGNFRALMTEHGSPQAILDTILSPGFSRYDQWEAQILANIQLKARVALLSEIADDEVRRAHLEPVHDVAAAVKAERDRLGYEAPVAVLPEGPMTIPYLT